MRVICIRIVWEDYQEGVDTIPRLGYENQTLNQLVINMRNTGKTPRYTLKQPRSSQEPGNACHMHIHRVGRRSGRCGRSPEAQV
jgi:hypothetical protein